MPMAAPRPCTGSPYCPFLADRCPHHRHLKTRDRHRGGTAQERGYTYRWSQYSKRFLQDHPVCGERADGTLDRVHSRCAAAGRTTPAQCVDHTIPVSKGGDFWSPENHMAACLSCNSAKGDR